MKTRTKYPNTQIFHVWVNQSENGPNLEGSSVYSRGPVIYSYGEHFPLAVKINGSTVINSRKYSNTTAKHQSQLSRAVHSNTIYAPMGGHQYGGYWDVSDPEILMNNVCYHLAPEIDELIEKVVKAVKPWIYLDQFMAIEKTVETIEQITGHKRTAEVATRIRKFYESVKIDEINDKRRKFEDSEEERRQARQAREEKKNAETLEKWKNGEPVQCPFLPFDILRLRGSIVETSRSIQMSIPEALAIYKRIQANELKPGDTVLDHYTVNAINGTARIGCHHFQTDYLLKFGAELEARFFNNQNTEQ